MHLRVKLVGTMLLIGAIVFSLNDFLLNRSDAVPGDLPLVEFPVAAGDKDVLAVILSGDGGWADLDGQFGLAFQQQGVATVGLDCLKYFCRAREPDAAANDLEGAIQLPR